MQPRGCKPIAYLSGRYFQNCYHMPTYTEICRTFGSMQSICCSIHLTHDAASRLQTNRLPIWEILSKLLSHAHIHRDKIEIWSYRKNQLINLSNPRCSLAVANQSLTYLGDTFKIVITCPHTQRYVGHLVLCKVSVAQSI